MSVSSSPRVYLAGPISGCTYAGCVEWRERAERYLALKGILALSPMRGCSHLSTYQGPLPANFSGDQDEAHACYTRDHFDLRSADVVLMNLQALGDRARVSIGTVVELGWATAYRKPLILVKPLRGMHDPHDHPFVQEAADYVTTDLDEALHIVVHILGAHTSEALNLGCR